MTWRETCDAIAENTDLPARTVDTVLKAFRDHVQQQLEQGERVAIPGLGTFDVRWTTGGVARSPATGRRIPYDGHDVPRFRASTRLREAVRNRVAQHLRDPAHRTAWRTASAMLGDLSAYHGAAAVPLPADATDQDVLAWGPRAFGDAWRRAREAYLDATPAEVTAAKDHFVAVARDTWGHTP